MFSRILVVFACALLAVEARGQACTYGEPPPPDCPSARVVSGTPGHHVVLMDVNNAVGGDTLCNINAGQLVWFEVTPTVSGPVTISTCHPNTLYDTVLQVFTGGDNNCQSMSFVTCDDDTPTDECDNGCSYWGSEVTFNAVAMQRYRFVVGAVNANAEECPLCLGVIVTIGEPCGIPPRGFDCSVAHEMPGTPGTHEILVDARDMPSFPEVWACGVNVGFNQWFSFTSEVNGFATFSTCHPATEYDTLVRAQTGECTGLLFNLGCVDDVLLNECTNDCGVFRGSKVQFPIQAGSPYLVEVGAFNNNAAACELCLGATLNIVDCDMSDPPVTQLTLPSDFGCYCDLGEIRGSAFDPEGALDAYTLSYRPAGTAPWSLIALNTTPVVDDVLGFWDTSALTDGWYFLRLVARDLCGDESSAIRIVRVGASFDEARLDAPADGAILGGTVCLDGTAWDQSCFDHYTVGYRPIGGGGFDPVEPGKPGYTSTRINEQLATWNTIGLGIPDGDYVLRLRGEADCGNSEDDSVTVTVDNTAPLAEITNVLPCAAVEGTLQIFGTALDEHLGGWVLQYTGGAATGWVDIASGNTLRLDEYLGTWNTSMLDPCPYTLRLVVTDEAALNCNGAIHHRSEYTVSVNIGFCGDFDADDDGDVDLFDYGRFQDEFTGELP